MNLEDFVATGLEQVVRGIQRAQTAVGTDARINPQVEGHPPTQVDRYTGTRLQDIEFDVAVTVTDGTQSGASLSVGVPWVKAGVKGGSEQSQSAVSRIKFSVPVALPKHMAHIASRET